MRRAALPLLLCCPVLFAQPQAIPAASPLRQFSFLLGSWTAETQSTELGKPEGVCSFAVDLGGHTIVRRNRVSYTSGKDAGTTHEDLLILYSEGAALRAIYFDSEGHVIRYQVSLPAPATVVFESEAAPGPRYRLTHAVEGNRLETKFEVAPPGQPFQTYVSGAAVRK